MGTEGEGKRHLETPTSVWVVMPFHTAMWEKVPFAWVVVLIYITAWW